ncbi:hypothetical protein [Streptomyces sp. NPDC059161]|uniref:hypothetical protein n=1 Tax=unclassified Streptomyces TaxID=2593676 RepID=UPI003646F1B4
MKLVSGQEFSEVVETAPEVAVSGLPHVIAHPVVHFIGAQVLAGRGGAVSLFAGYASCAVFGFNGGVLSGGPLLVPQDAGGHRFLLLALSVGSTVGLSR